MATKKQFLQSVSWNSVAKITTEVLAVVQLAIVARYIDKADFGLMSIVHVVLGMTGMFTDLGMWAAMMHKQNITDDQYRSLYWFNWFLNVLIFFVVCVASVITAEIYHDIRLIHLIILAGIRILISPFGKVFVAIKNKNLEFKFISLVTIATNLLTFGLTVSFCVMGFGIYSLIVPGLCAAVVGAVVYTWAGRSCLRITWHYSFAEIRDFFKIGIYDTGAQLMDYLSYKIDVLLVGKFFGMEGLGLYNMGKELALKTMKVIAPIINPVITPILAKIQNDTHAIKSNYLRILNLIATVNFPVLWALFVFADPVVHLFFSAKYADAAVFVKILCFWGMFASIGNPAGNLVVAKGRTDLSFRWTIIRFCCVPPTVFICSYFTINAVAYAQVLLQIVFFVIYWRILIYPLSDIHFGEYVSALKPGFIGAFVAALPAILFNYYWNADVLIGLILGCLVYGITYVICTYILNRDFIGYLLSYIKKA